MVEKEDGAGGTETGPDVTELTPRILSSPGFTTSHAYQLLSFLLNTSAATPQTLHILALLFNDKEEGSGSPMSSRVEPGRIRRRIHDSISME